MRTAGIAAGPSFVRRARIWLSPETDIELSPDKRTPGQRLYDAGLFGILTVIFVPWLIVVATMFAAVDVVRWLDERSDRRWSEW